METFALHTFDYMCERGKNSHAKPSGSGVISLWNLGGWVWLTGSPKGIKRKMVDFLLFPAKSICGIYFFKWFSGVCRVIPVIRKINIETTEGTRKKKRTRKSPIELRKSAIEMRREIRNFLEMAYKVKYGIFDCVFDDMISFTVVIPELIYITTKIS